MRLSFGVLLTEYISERFAVNKRKCHQILVLIITFLVYVVYHMSRRSISIVKPEFNHKNCSSSQFLDPNKNASENHHDNPNWCNWFPSDEEDIKIKLGWLDTSYLASYAVFMFVAGYVAERCDLRYFLTVNLILCGLCNIVFGIGRSLNIHNYYYYLVIQIITGVIQTGGWPAVVAAVGNWFGHSKKGLIFGIWSWHCGVGNIVGTVIAGAFVEEDWGLSFIVPGLICIGMAVIVLLFLIPAPQYVGLSPEETQLPDKLNDGNPSDDKHCNVETDTQAISFLGALKIPGVIEYSVSLFFAKLVAFTFLYWLPEYINQTIKVSPSESAYLSISFDIGGAVGAMLIGYISDTTDASAVTCMGFLSAAIPSLLVFYKWGAVNMASNQSLQFITGLFVNGPYSLITTAVSADLATKIPCTSAMATVSAIIDGTGSIGAAIGPLLAGYLDKLGWADIFYMMMLSDFIAVLCLLRAGYNELRRLQSQRRAKQKESQINRFSYKM